MIVDHTIVSTEQVRLDPAGVCSKFGFSDGDALDDMLFNLKRTGMLPDKVRHHDVLADMVGRYIAPLFNGRVVLERITNTMHNPIRATWIDGEPFDSYPGGDNTPDWIHLTPNVTITTQHVVGWSRAFGFRG